MEQVHSKYGKDALVVSNKRARNKTELIVAVDVEYDTNAVLSELKTESSSPPGDHTRVSVGFDQIMEESVFKTSPSNRTTHPESLPYVSKSDLKFNSSFDNVGDEREQLHAREIVDLVKQELAVMRRELALSGQLEAMGPHSVVSDAMHPLVKALNDSGMSISLQTMMIDLIKDEKTFEDAIENIGSVLGSNIATIDILDDMSGVHVISGGSGSGKTIMSTRLARQKAMKYGEDSVALISYQDTRFGAWSQMQVLSSQAGIETFRAQSEEALKHLFEELGSRKLIIIDTPGVGGGQALSSINKLMPNAQCHLIVPADSSEGSIKKHMKMNKDNWTSIIVSRLEGGIHPWPLINVLLNEKIPVSVAVDSPLVTEHAGLINGVSLLKRTLYDLPMSFI
jgi:flagellar biosynthesis GTPase FlhF